MALRCKALIVLSNKNIVVPSGQRLKQQSAAVVHLKTAGFQGQFFKILLNYSGSLNIQMPQGKVRHSNPGDREGGIYILQNVRRRQVSPQRKQRDRSDHTSQVSDFIAVVLLQQQAILLISSLVSEEVEAAGTPGNISNLVSLLGKVSPVVSSGPLEYCNHQNHESLYNHKKRPRSQSPQLRLSIACTWDRHFEYGH